MEVCAAGAGLAKAGWLATARAVLAKTIMRNVTVPFFLDLIPSIAGNLAQGSFI
jgi:hypothetical protein